MHQLDFLQSDAEGRPVGHTDVAKVCSLVSFFIFFTVGNKRWPSFSRVWFSSWFALYVVDSYWNTVLQVLTGNSLVNRTVLNILIDSDQTWWGNMKLARGGLFLWKVRRGIPSLCTGTRTRPLCESLTQLCHRNPGINTAVDVFTSQQIVGNFLTPLEISLNVLDIWVAWSYLAQSENSK